MPRTPLIRTTNAGDMPAAGRWVLGVGPTVTVGWNRRRSRHRAADPSGTLIVGEGSRDVHLMMSLVDTSGALIEIEADLVSSDPAGRWNLVGDATIAGNTVPVAVEARYHGVFRRDRHAWTELAFRAHVGRRAWRRRRLTIDANVIFDAPEVITRAAA